MISSTFSRSVVDYGVDVSKLKTFGTMGKQVRVLHIGKETELFLYDGKGLITHMWFGGNFKGYEDIKLRIYVE